MGNGNWRLKRITALRPFTLLLLLTPLAAKPQAAEGFKSESPAMSSVKQIWSNAPHNGFTDLIRYHDTWYCSFREGTAHGSKDGKIRILSSADGEAWTSVNLIADTAYDLRDPHFCVTPKGRLMLSYAAIAKDSVHQSREGRVQFSADGDHWTSVKKMNIRSKFVWRVTWYNNIAYMVAYDDKKGTYLYKSKDAVHYDTVTRVNLPGFVNEASLVFLPNGDMQMLIRNEYPPKKAYIGTSKAPYSHWDFKVNSDVFAGGPNMLRLPDESIFAGLRQYESGEGKMILFKSENSVLKEVLRLPAGGDTGYPGMYLYHNELWVSYYSSHEGKANIYLAKVHFGENPPATSTSAR